MNQNNKRPTNRNDGYSLNRLEDQSKRSTVIWYFVRDYKPELIREKCQIVRYIYHRLIDPLYMHFYGLCFWFCSEHSLGLKRH